MTSGVELPSQAERVVIGVALLVIGGIHLILYVHEEYNRIPTIGVLFLLTAASSVVLAGLIFVRPSLLAFMASLGFALAVFAGYLLSLYLPNGLFLFKELEVSYSGGVSICAEAIVAVVGSASLLRHRSLRLA